MFGEQAGRISNDQSEAKALGPGVRRDERGERVFARLDTGRLHAGRLPPVAQGGRQGRRRGARSGHSHACPVPERERRAEGQYRHRRHRPGRPDPRLHPRHQGRRARDRRHDRRGAGLLHRSRPRRGSGRRPHRQRSDAGAAGRTGLHPRPRGRRRRGPVRHDGRPRPGHPRGAGGQRPERHADHQLCGQIRIKLLWPLSRRGGLFQVADGRQEDLSDGLRQRRGGPARSGDGPVGRRRRPDRQAGPALSGYRPAGVADVQGSDLRLSGVRRSVARSRIERLDPADNDQVIAHDDAVVGLTAQARHRVQKARRLGIINRELIVRQTAHAPGETVGHGLVLDRQHMNGEALGPGEGVMSVGLDVHAPQHQRRVQRDGGEAVHRDPHRPVDLHAGTGRTVETADHRSDAGRPAHPAGRSGRPLDVRERLGPPQPARPTVAACRGQGHQPAAQPHLHHRPYQRRRRLQPRQQPRRLAPVLGAGRRLASGLAGRRRKHRPGLFGRGQGGVRSAVSGRSVAGGQPPHRHRPAARGAGPAHGHQPVGCEEGLRKRPVARQIRT
uniref:LigA n=1 Tax=Parastrongyloides trichosuri TaxID=131310 RepID=A0A0N4ZJN2_PARTI